MHNEVILLLEYPECDLTHLRVQAYSLKLYLVELNGEPSRA